MADTRPFVRRYPRRNRLRLLGMIGFAAFVVIAAGALLVDRLPVAGRVHAASTDTLVGFRVIDGDTIDLGGTRIRIADIDAPELFSPKCATERALAEQSRDRLAALLAEGPVTLAPYERDIDRYGRQLRIVTRDGHSLGATLVAEGLARDWDGKRHPWC